MAAVHDIARERMQDASDRQKRGYDHRMNKKSYKPGDSVYLYNPCRQKGVSPKLQSFWEGPFLVIETISDLVYKIQKGPKAKIKIVHHDRLKPCFEKVNSWLGKDDNTPLPVEARDDLIKVPDNSDALVKSDEITTPVDLEPSNLQSEEMTEIEEHPTNISFRPAPIPSKTTRSGRVTRPPRYIQQFYSF